MPSKVKAYEPPELCSSDSLCERHIPLSETTANSLISHIIAMADDEHFCGHPEWHEIVAEATVLKMKGY